MKFNYPEFLIGQGTLSEQNLSRDGDLSDIVQSCGSFDELDLAADEANAAR